MMEQKKFEQLEVTHIDIFLFKEGVSLGRMKAIATIVLND